MTQTLHHLQESWFTKDPQYCPWIACSLRA